MTVEMFARTYDLDSIEVNRSGDGRTVTAYAAVFDQDAEIRDQHGHYLERISRSAFNRTLRNGPVSRIGVFYNHGYDLSGKPNMVGSVPIGTPLEVRPDQRGLLTVTRYNKSPLADQVIEAIRDGQITGQSFRGRVYRSEESPGTGGGLKVVTRSELGLQEYGPTHAPAYEGAGILAIRSKDDLEEAVRNIIKTFARTDSLPSLTDDPATPSGLGPADPVPDHSRKIEAVRNAQRVRALTLGVIGHGRSAHRRANLGGS